MGIFQTITPSSRTLSFTSSSHFLPSSTSYSSDLPTSLQPATITTATQHPFDTTATMPADAVRSLSATNDVEPEKRLPHPSVVSSSVTIPVTSTVSLAPRRS